MGPASGRGRCEGWAYHRSEGQGREVGAGPCARVHSKVYTYVCRALSAEAFPTLLAHVVGIHLMPNSTTQAGQFRMQARIVQE